MKEGKSLVLLYFKFLERKKVWGIYTSMASKRDEEQ